jgi:predicted P-loop ATPase
VDAVQKIGGAAVDAWWQSEAPHVFDDGTAPPEVPPGRGRAQFKLGENDVILKTMENAAIGLSALGVECSYDQFHHRAWLQQADGTRSKLTDHAMLLLRVELNTAYGRDFGPVHVYDAIMALALLNGFNPVCDMLREAERGWDGVLRLDRLGPDYFHSEDTELARRCFRKTMIAAVRRARRPGCKFDQILVTESPEGWDKSSAWEVLAGAENFSDADILGKDARQVQEELADIWIHEIADLAGLKKADVEHVKAFASRTNDRARPAYGRVLLDQPRQSICVGTTNDEVYLPSPTGNRRFWPFKLDDRVELARLREDRLLLWGEAAAAESLGETLVLDRALWSVAGKAQEKRHVVDTWEDELVNLPEERMQDWDGEQFISNIAVQEYLGGYRRQTFNSWSGRRIAGIMKRLNWERCSRFMDGKAHRGYKRVKPVDVMPSVIHPKFDNPF